MALDRTPARVQRESRRASSARTLARLFLAHDLTDREAADLAAVPHQHVQQWRDPDAPRAMSFADALALPSRMRRALAEVLVGAGCVVLDLPNAGEAAGLEHAAEMARERGDVVQRHLVALADGRIDAGEARGLLPEIDEDIRALVALRSACERAVAEGVVVPMRKAAR